MDATDQRKMSELEHKRSLLCLDLFNVRSELKGYKEKLLMSGEDGFDIDGANIDKYGEKGRFVVKSKNDYQKPGKDFLVDQTIAWYKTLYPDESEDEVKRFAYGFVEFIWSNRDKTTIRYVERLYDSTPEHKKRKRRNVGDRPAKKQYVRRPDDTPVTTAEFLESSIGSKMFSST